MKADWYRRRAAECEVNASIAKDPQVASAYREAARHWRELADQVERMLGSENDSPRSEA